MNKSIIFDCDGVLLDSNPMKTEAFRFCLQNYQKNVVDEFIDYQKKNFGKSRKVLFEIFFKSFLKEEKDEAELEKLLEKFGGFTRQKYLIVQETKDLRRVLQNLIEKDYRLFVVSGSDQKELNEVFEIKGLTPYFEQILGSPVSKTENLIKLKADLLKERSEVVCYVGDSTSDMIAAKHNGIDFVYMSGYEAYTIASPVDFLIKDLTQFEANVLCKHSYNIFLPCRAGSQRIKNKNTKQFGNIKGGLIELKLEQLSLVSKVNSITISTDDPLVKDIALKFRLKTSTPIHVLDRPNEVAISDNLDLFIKYVGNIMPKGNIIWIHVTSPFFDNVSIEKAISIFERNSENGKYDSLIGVNRIQNFLIKENKFISHNRESVKWPQTQDIDPIFEINSSVFIMSKNDFIQKKDRMGDVPYLHETTKLESLDIDWPEDFDFCEKLFTSLY